MKILKDFKHLVKGEIKIGNVKRKIPLIRLNEIITSIGIDAHQFIDNFQYANSKIPGSLEVLRSGKEDVRRKMLMIPNAYALPIERGQRLFNVKAGKLLVPDRIWFDTTHVISIYFRKPVLSNIFYAIRLKKENENCLKALCLCFNTTWGITSVLANRQETRGAWIRLKMSQWRLLHVLNINKLSEDELKLIVNVFDKFKDVDLGRIPQQYNVKNNTHKLRLELDKNFLEAIGVQIEDNDLIDLYQEIYSSFEQWMG